ncbi:hypothetical protein C8J56DRAFT_486348 [Mycena floridula]|nr:hypothetical protein C8J56DRAFT_486348 [Mycena floridula]
MDLQITGSIEIGVSVAVILLGISTVQTFVYFQTGSFARDSRLLKFTIATLLLLELGHTVSVSWGLYVVVIRHYGQLFLPLPRQLRVGAVAGSIVHPLVQAIYAARIYQFSSSIILPAICWAFTGAIVGATILLIVQVASMASMSQLVDEWRWLLLALFTATACIDLIIASAMYNNLMRHSKTLSSSPFDIMSSRLVQSGALMSITAIGGAICFGLMSHNNVWLSILLVMTGVHTNSILALLNGRLHYASDVTQGRQRPLSAIVLDQSSREESKRSAHLKGTSSNTAVPSIAPTNC